MTTPTDGAIVPAARLEPDLVQHIPVAEGVALHTRRWDGDGHPFVLVHGLASNARMWDGVAATLAAAGHAVAAIDQRGHGLSSKPDPTPGGPDGPNPYDMHAVTDDLRALIEELGFERPVVVGQSWGGNVVIELAARYPGSAAGVVGVDGGTIELSTRFPDWDDAATALRPPPTTGTPRIQLEATMRRMHPDWPDTGIEGALACFEVRDDGTVSPWLDVERHLRVLRGLWEHRPSERYGSVVDPVLFLVADSGDEGWRAEKERGMRAAESALASVEVEWMDGDHDLHAQHPVQVAERLRRFLDTVSS